jgi:hypothetical protein
VREGDVIIGIGDVDVKWSTHEEVVSLIKHARNDLSLRLIQPVEKPTQPSKVIIIIIQTHQFIILKNLFSFFFWKF